MDPAIFLTGKPLHLILHVTNRCNLKCKPCFVNFDNVGEDELTLEEIWGISAYFGRLLCLDLSGGEPFLRKDLPELCSLFNVQFMSIPTNGFDPNFIYEETKKIRSKIKAQLNIAVSLDGFENTNDDIRGPACFKRAMETLRLLKTVKDVKVKVNTVLCERNYDEIIDFMKFVKDLNPDFHSIIFRRGVKRAPALFECPSYEKLTVIKENIFKVWDTYDYGFRGIKRSFFRNYLRCLYNTSLRVINEKKQIPACLAWKYHLVAYSNGDIALCEMSLPLGNIRNTSIEELLRSKDADTQRDIIRAKGCYCHHNCNMVDNFLLNPLNYPKLLGGNRYA